MGMVARPQRIASAYVVFFGQYGDVSRYAEQRGVSRHGFIAKPTDCCRSLLKGKNRSSVCSSKSAF
jgi:hypothetical protein